ncbi:contractile injection system protein, VgrG/Pvc8 family [Buttiauxella brennerae]|uniref:contractile injection system protein, VgrG/Pvc8 family n=1 Tax=Buttiauxella brennerae TaxID=82988 RepID=UPI00286EC7DE|nr:contractile injection system protein, VgrG/Pvc8 family [Buttiauxella brennerae]
MDNVKPYLPTFSIIAEDKDITSEISKYLTDLVFIDYGATDEDPQSDKVTINLVSPTMALPKKGAKLKLALGFDSYLVDKGSFIVDEVTLQGPPRTLGISALAVPSDNTKHAANMQSQKTRAWDNMSIGEIVKTIALENGLQPAVSPELAGEMPGHLDQLYANDAEFLARLARQYDAISKASGGRWIFMPQGTGKTMSGKSLPEITITPDGKTNWQFAHRSKARSRAKTAKGNKGALIVPYMDAATGHHKTIVYGTGEGAATVGYMQPSREAAEAYIKNQQRDDTRAEAAAASGKKAKKPKPEYLMSMSITLPATPELLSLTPESTVITEGFDPQADREWLVDNIAFRLSPNEGMSISMELKR